MDENLEEKIEEIKREEEREKKKERRKKEILIFLLIIVIFSFNFKEWFWMFANWA